MEFIWDDPNDVDGNTYHILSGHPEMQSTRFIEQVFNTSSGDEVAYVSSRNGENFLVITKTYRRRPSKLVFQMQGGAIRIKTAYPTGKRRS